MRENLRNALTWVVTIFVFVGLAYVAGCTEPAPELPPVVVTCPDTTALISCRSQRQAAVDRVDELEGDLADKAVEINSLRADIEALRARTGLMDPLYCDNFTDPPEKWCVYPVSP